MFLAIINDTYADVKTEIAIAPDELQMSHFLKRGVNNIFRKLGIPPLFKPSEVDKDAYTTTIDQIRTTLRA